MSECCVVTTERWTVRTLVYNTWRVQVMWLAFCSVLFRYVYDAMQREVASEACTRTRRTPTDNDWGVYSCPWQIFALSNGDISLFVTSNPVYTYSMEQRLSWEAIRSSASREIPRINQLLGKVLRDLSAIYMAKSVIWMFVLILSSLWNLPLWTTLILGWWMNRQVKHEPASFKCFRGPIVL
jgi:hypothetical protein